MRTKQLEIFTYSELSDAAKEKAREWWLGGLNYDDWWDFTYSDFIEIADILGVDIGGTKSNPEIFFSGFWGKGDGACFYGSYAYKPGAAKAIRAYAPKADDLHDIADRLQEIQRRYFYRLSAHIERNPYAGNCSHEHTTQVTVYDDGRRLHKPESEDTIDDVTDALRDLMRWLYRSLQAEYEYLTSDEVVAEAIKANEYEFTADGSLYQDQLHNQRSA